jgi:hypothetical protein
MSERMESRGAQRGARSKSCGVKLPGEARRQRTNTPKYPGWGTAAAADAESGADLASAHALCRCHRPVFGFGVRLQAIRQEVRVLSVREDVGIVVNFQDADPY